MTKKSGIPLAERRAASYRRNRDAHLAYAAAYRAANADLIKAKTAGKHSEYSARYRQRNPEKCRAKGQAWKDANRDRRAETKAIWQRQNAERHRIHQHNRRARERNAGGNLSHDLAQRLYAAQQGRCACCKRKLGDAYDMDHIVPLARGGTNTDENIQLLTSRCNRQKGAKHPVEFMQSRGLLL
jgi:5-methylcytosine-specific restriction endonuclease McrA